MISSFHLAVFAALVVAVATPIILWLRRTPEKSTFAQPVFTPAGRSFFGQLDMAVRSHCIVFPNIPVTSLVRAKSFSRSGSLLSKFQSDVFDYVICDRKTMDVKCVITLNSKSQKTAKKTDAFVRLCQYAGLTLLQYEEKPYRNVPALRRQIFTSCGIEESQMPENHKRKYTMTVSHDESETQSLRAEQHASGSEKIDAEQT